MWWSWLACASEMPVDETPLGPGDEVPTDVPTEVPTDDLAGWLDRGAYLAWPAEAAPHPSAGPHFGDVRTFFSPRLADSLEAGDDRHPPGAASVKELFGRDGSSSPLGYAVMVRVGAGPTGKDWFWYEDFAGSVYADGVGEDLCVDCHADGVDFVLSAGPE